LIFSEYHVLFIAAYYCESWAQQFERDDGSLDYDFTEGSWGKSQQLVIAARLYRIRFVLFQPEELPRFTIFHPTDVCRQFNAIQINIINSLLEWQTQPIASRRELFLYPFPRLC
jgi:hypothetical protein